MKPRKAKPQNLPKPTYWPFILAFGCCFMLWGLLNSMVFSLIGLLVFIVAIGGWMHDLYNELRNRKEK